MIPIVQENYCPNYRLQIVELDPLHQSFLFHTKRVNDQYRRNHKLHSSSTRLIGIETIAVNITCDNVVDVCKVATHVAVVEHLDRLAGENALREDEVGHVGPSQRVLATARLATARQQTEIGSSPTPRPVDREEPQARAPHAKEMRVRVRHQLIRLLRCAVERRRRVAHRVEAKRRIAIQTVDRRRRGVRQRRVGVRAAPLEHIEEADNVRRHVAGGWCIG